MSPEKWRLENKSRINGGDQKDFCDIIFGRTFLQLLFRSEDGKGKIRCLQWGEFQDWSCDYRGCSDVPGGRYGCGNDGFCYRGVVDENCVDGGLAKDVAIDPKRGSLEFSDIGWCSDLTLRSALNEFVKESRSKSRSKGLL